MKINYRGVSYEYNPPQVEYGDLTQSGKYRGVDVRFRNAKKAPVLQPTLDLVYRGVAYTTNPSETALATNAPEATEAVATKPIGSTIGSTIQERARALMMNHHRNIKQRQQAMLSRSDARVGLPTAEASRFWNHIQGQVHPAFSDSYDRSGAALS